MGDRGPRTEDGWRRRTLPTSNVQRTDFGLLGGVEKKKSGPRPAGTGRGQYRAGPGRAPVSLFPFLSLFPSLSLSPVPCRCRALKPPIRWHRGPGRAGWCCWLVVGDPRGVAVGSGIVVGAWAGWPWFVDDTPTQEDDTPQGHPGTVPRWSSVRRPEGSQGQFRARQQEGEKDGKEVHRERASRWGEKSV